MGWWGKTLKYLHYQVVENVTVLLALLYILFTAIFVTGGSTQLVTLLALVIGASIALLYKKYLTRLLVCICISFTLAYLRVGSVDNAYEMSRLHFTELGDGDFEGSVFEIVSDPQERHQETLYTVREIRKSGSNIERAKIRIESTRYPVFEVGDICTFGSNFKIRDVSPKYFEYYQNKGIAAFIEVTTLNCQSRSLGLDYLSFRTYIWRIKAEITEKTGQILLEPQASLMLGMIFGDDRLFSDDFDAALRISGTTHIIAASGFNVSILYFYIEKLLGRHVGRNTRLILSTFVIWTFALFADMSGSIIRATTMLTACIVYRISGQRYSAFDSLLLTVFSISAVSPKLLLDVGFQLSLAATLGILLIYTPLQGFVVFFRTRIRNVISNESESMKLPELMENALATVACTCSTIPISNSNFGSGSFFGVFPNIVVLNLVEPIYYLAIITLVTYYLVSDVVGLLLFKYLDFLLRLFVQIIRWFAVMGSMPYASFMQSQLVIYLNIVFVSVVLIINLFNKMRESFIGKESIYLHD